MGHELRTGEVQAWDHDPLRHLGSFRVEYTPSWSLMYALVVVWSHARMRWHLGRPVKALLPHRLHTWTLLLCVSGPPAGVPEPYPHVAGYGRVILPPGTPSVLGVQVRKRIAVGHVIPWTLSTGLPHGTMPRQVTNW